MQRTHVEQVEMSMNDAFALEKVHKGCSSMVAANGVVEMDALILMVL